MPVDGRSWWATLDGVLPGGEELAEAVAAELGEPVEDVRPSVMITLLVGSVAASLDDLRTVLDGERARAGLNADRRRREPMVEAANMDELLDEAVRLADAGTLDITAAAAVQRASGAIAARSGQRLVLYLARLAVIRRLVWDHSVEAAHTGRLDGAVLGELGRWIFLWTEVTSLVVTDGYRTEERDILARDAQARRGALEEILGVVPSDAYTTARLRRVAARFGLDPDSSLRLVVVAPRPEADPTPDRTGIDHDDLEILAGRIGHLLGSAAPGAEGAGAGIRLPVVLPMRGRIVILARADRTGPGRVTRTLDTVLRGPAERPDEAGVASRPSAWVAVGSLPVDGAEHLGGSLADLVDAVRTAEDVGLRGWIPDPGHLAVERLLLAQRDLGEAAVQHELGPLLADERLGPELVETLQVYFDAGENMRETARRLHLANRTVAYRLEKIETLLGGPLDGSSRRRVSVALLVRRLQGDEGA